MTLWCQNHFLLMVSLTLTHGYWCLLSPSLLVSEDFLLLHCFDDTKAQKKPQQTLSCLDFRVFSNFRESNLNFLPKNLKNLSLAGIFSLALTCGSREFWSPPQPNPPIRSHDARQNRFDDVYIYIYLFNFFFPNKKVNTCSLDEITRVQPKTLDQKTLRSSKTMQNRQWTSSPFLSAQIFAYSQPLDSNPTPPAFHMWSVLRPGAGYGCHGQCKGRKREGCLNGVVVVFGERMTMESHQTKENHHFFY